MEKQKKWSRRIKCAVLVFGVIIIPLFYSYFYLGAFWDPYSRLDTVPVAVVNNDTGATISGKSRNLGNELVDNLKTEKSLKWIFTNDKEAKDGMQTGKKYYAVITIPSDFSLNIATADSTNKKEATIIYSSNEKRNYLATQILHSASLQLEEKVRSEVTKDITAQLVSKLNDVPSQLVKLDDGFVKLSDGTTTLSNGMTKLNTGAQSLSVNLGTLNNGLGQAYTGSKKLNNGLSQFPTLVSGITTLNNGAGQLSSGLNLAAAGAFKLNSGAAKLPTLTSGITQVADGASQVFAGTTKLSKGTSDLFAGTTKLSNGTSALLAGATDLSKGTSDLLVGTTTLSTGASQLSDGAQQYVTMVTTIMQTLQNTHYDVNTAVAAFNGQISQIQAKPTLTEDDRANIQSLSLMKGILLGDQASLAYFTTKSTQLASTAAEVANGAAAANAGATQANDGATKLKAGAADANTGAANVNAGAKEVNDGAAAANDGAKRVSDGAAQLKAHEADLAALQKGVSDLNTALTQLNAGGKQVSGGTSALAANTAQLQQLQSGVSQLNAALAKLQNGSSQLYDGSKTLQTGISSAKDGTAKLQDGINTAKTGVDDSITTAKEELKSTDGLDKYSGEAVSLKSSPTNPVPNYGTAFAPYFLSLSMWVGALMMLFGIYLDPGRRIKHLAKGSDSRFIRIVIFFGIGIAQSLLLAIVLQAGLGLHVNNVVPYYFSIILGSMTFISVVQFCIVNLGDIGKFLSILFLILQLTSCGGTFPMETLSPFFNALYKFMPMTYTVELLREVISGNDMGYAWHNALVLIGVVVIFAALTVMFAFLKRAKQKRLASVTITEVENIHA